MQIARAARRLPLLITNNSCCAEAFAEQSTCLFDEGWNYGQVLEQARDRLHQGYVLLSHPQGGSLKPNQTPYKSLVLARVSPNGLDNFTSLSLIEQAIESYGKFQRMRPTPDWAEHIRQDFRTVDLSLMQGVFGRFC